MITFLDSFPCVTRRMRNTVCDPFSLTVTLSSFPKTIPRESRIELAGSVPSGAILDLPSQITSTGPFLLIDNPPVSLS